MARADVFIQNLTPVTATRLGFGSEALRNEFPALITCDISGYAEVGPSHVSDDVNPPLFAGEAAVLGLHRSAVANEGSEMSRGKRLANPILARLPALC